MRKDLLTVCCGIAVSLSAVAQYQGSSQYYETKKVEAVRAYDGSEVGGSAVIKQPNRTVASQQSKADFEKIVGQSTYDLQTNASVQSRIVNHGSDNVTMTWTYSQSFDLAASDRGTGYNQYTSAGLATPYTMVTSKQEASTRTGWSSLSVTSNGAENVVAHPASPGGTFRFMTRSAVGSGAWTESNIPTSTGHDMLWPRSVVGGPNGQSIHVIGVTAPEGNDGSLYNGVDGQILYWRSRDGGSTWDIQDKVLPGLDSNDFYRFSGDTYAMDASGSTIAFAVFNSYADIVLLKSTDNGSNWTKTIVNDFPIDKMTLEMDLDANNDLIGNDTVFTSDGSGDIIIDNNGKVHIVWGDFMYVDNAYGDNAFSYIIGWNGIRYWSEINASAEPVVIAGAIDEDGDGVITPEGGSFTTGIGDYVLKSISSFPSLGIDANDALYLSYSAVNDAFSNGIQTYRHMYISKSEDDGATWSTPIDMTNAPVHEFKECMFGAMARDVDTHVHIVYQQDDEPGLAVRGDDGDAYTQNDIVYLKIESDLGFGTIGTPDGVADIKGFDGEVTLMPNPANHQVQIKVIVKESQELNYRIMNLQGQEVASVNNVGFNAGTNMVDVDLTDIESGVYFINLYNDEQFISKRLVVSH